MSLTDFRSHYWMKTDLIAFARELRLPTSGYKPELTARIERRLEGLPDEPRAPRREPKGRDSDKPLTRKRAVVSYRSDAKTREFFRSQIGPHFHFTYHVNQFRLAQSGLTYGDLVDEWIAEWNRRREPTYRARIADHGKWNRFVRDYFEDENNEGKSLNDAAAAWRKAKAARGDHRYKPAQR